MHVSTWLKVSYNCYVQGSANGSVGNFANGAIGCYRRQMNPGQFRLPVVPKVLLVEPVVPMVPLVKYIGQWTIYKTIYLLTHAELMFLSLESCIFSQICFHHYGENSVYSACLKSSVYYAILNDVMFRCPIFTALGCIQNWQPMVSNTDTTGSTWHIHTTMAQSVEAFNTQKTLTVSFEF